MLIGSVNNNSVKAEENNNKELNPVINASLTGWFISSKNIVDPCLSILICFFKPLSVFDLTKRCEFCKIKVCSK